MFYGVWGDENGNDGQPLVGEASLSMATLCYGKSINGNSGHDQNDVMYIAFKGKDAVPGSLRKQSPRSFTCILTSTQAPRPTGMPNRPPPSRAAWALLVMLSSSALVVVAEPPTHHLHQLAPGLATARAPAAAAMTTAGKSSHRHSS